MKSIQLKAILALFLTGILVWTGCGKKDEKPNPVGPSISNFSATSTPSGTLSTNGDTLKVNLGASITFSLKVSKGNTSEDKVLKQFKVTKELIGVGPLPNLKDTTYAQNLNKDNITYTINDAVSSTTSGTYKYVFSISDYNNKTATKVFWVKAGAPCGIGVSVTSVASDSLTVTVAGSGLTTGSYEYSFDNGGTWSSTATHTYNTTGNKTILVRNSANTACASSTTFNVTGKKLREKIGVLLGGNTSSEPSLYDVEGEQRYSYTAVNTGSETSAQSLIDFVLFSGTNFVAPSHSISGENYSYSNWPSTNRNATKFYGSINQSTYDGATTNANLLSLISGSSTTKSPTLSVNNGFAFESVNSSGTVVSRGLVLVTNISGSGSSIQITFKVKRYQVN